VFQGALANPVKIGGYTQSATQGGADFVGGVFRYLGLKGRVFRSAMAGRLGNQQNRMGDLMG
jgi:hypothetical protein